MRREKPLLSINPGFSLAELAVVVLIVALVSTVFLWRFLASERSPSGSRIPLIVVTPDGVGWNQTSPPGSSALVAVLSGDPGMRGSAYVIRMRAVRNCEIALHMNRTDEQITVLQGTATISLESASGGSRPSCLPEGSYCFIPKQYSHFIRIEAGSLLQIEGTGPSFLVCADSNGPRALEGGNAR
jgi:hypothetical protein